MKILRALGVLCVLVLTTWFACHRIFGAVVIEMPAGYSGWVRVDLDAANCRTADPIIKVASDGTACLAKSISGWTMTTYKYEGDDKELNDRGSERTRRIWAQSTIEWTDRLGGHRALGFFVGTREELRWTPSPRLPRID